VSLPEAMTDSEGHVWVHDPEDCPIEEDQALQQIAMGPLNSAGAIQADVLICNYTDADMYCVLPCGHTRSHMGYPHWSPPT
jgi:hypothetical protein